MGSEAEPAKKLLSYLQRADELQKHEPLVAYYCRLFAMDKGLKIPSKERTKTTNSILVSLMNQLEKDKKSVKLGPDDNLHVEGFASSIFAKADKQDRAGRADINTAKTFYAASVFFEILTQFGELEPDIEQKMKYAIWKAADIRKALKEGRRPEPGPPDGDQNLEIPSNAATSTPDLRPNVSFSTNLPDVDASSLHVDKVNQESPDTPSPYRSPDYPSADVQRGYIRPYPQPSFHEQSMPHDYPHEPPNNSSHEPRSQDYPIQGASPGNYPSQDTSPTNYPPYDAAPNYPSNESSIPPYSLPNFHSYPSFNDSSLPTAPVHYPSHYQGPDAGSAHHSLPPQNYTPTVQCTSDSRNSIHTGSAPPPVATYTYDSNYEPSVEKIAEAHKAARFAVGALAFDDVPVAVDFLRRSLELLTNPSAKSH